MFSFAVKEDMDNDVTSGRSGTQCFPNEAPQPLTSTLEKRRYEDG